MKPQFIQPDWPAPQQVKAYTTLRGENSNAQEDYSQRPDLPSQIVPPKEPIWIKQVHGNRVIEALDSHRDQEADASFTRQTQQVCAVFTADCLPLLVCDQDGTHAAAIHAGWRGLAKGIIGNTLNTLGLPSQNLLVWLGPAIGPQKFEVGEDVYTLFINQSEANQVAFTQTSPSTWLANIYELARIQLLGLGVSQIYGGNYCTFSQSEYFFSYRRDKGKTGRLVSLIWIDS